MDEFQQRVLAALEKPKRNRFLGVINSAFFLWLMSALFLSIGGSYITNHRQCLDDAEKIIERRKHLSQELLSRNAALAARVSEAKTLQEANQEASALLMQQPPAANQDKRGSIFTDLFSRNYPEIQAEAETFTGRIKYAEHPDPTIAEHRKKSVETALDEKMYKEIQQSPPDAGRKLKLMQVEIRFFVASQMYKTVLDLVAYDFRPNCSIINVAKLAFGYRPPIVFAAVNPLSTTPNGKIAIEVATKEIEQRQKDLESEVKKTN
jgi:hypothetical protein